MEIQIESNDQRQFQEPIKESRWGLNGQYRWINIIMVKIYQQWSTTSPSNQGTRSSAIFTDEAFWFLIPFTNTSAGDVWISYLYIHKSSLVCSQAPSLRNMNTRGKLGIFSHVSMMQSKKVQNRKVMFYAIFIQLCAVCSSLLAG